MRSVINTGIKYAGILLASILLGMMLMILVYCLPVSSMKANVQRSTEIYEYEGVYPQLMWGYKMSQLDNSTDATMLLNAIYSGSGSVVEKAVRVFRIEYSGENPVISLIKYANDTEAEIYGCAYSRYWHGYLAILKPLLLFFDVADIRVMNMFLQMALFCYIVLLMIRRKYGEYVPAFLISVLLLNPVAIALSFQFSTVYYLMLFSIIYILKKKNLLYKQEILLLFLLGILTAFFDFLTYPLAALFFPLIFILLKENDGKEAIKKVFIGSIVWGIGYVGMWCGKWTIGSILLGQNLWTDALERAMMYEAMDYGNGKINGFQVIFKNVMVLVKWPVLLAGVVLLLYYIKWIMKVGILKIRLKERSLYLAAFGLIFMAPFAWYLAAGTHSYIHYWFTYRELCISVFAVLAGITKMISLCGESADEEQDIVH